MNNDMAKSSPSAAGFFYRRIGGTLFKVRVYTGSGYADTLDEKIPRLILNEMWVHSPPLGAQGNFNRKERHDTM